MLMPTTLNRINMPHVNGDIQATGYNLDTLNGGKKFVEDFFHSGWQSSQNHAKLPAEDYKEFATAMLNALDTPHGKRAPFSVPERLTISFQGHDVTFGAGSSDVLSVETRTSGLPTVSKTIYSRVCTALLLRHLSGLPLSEPYLTEDGGINLKGADLSQGMDLNHADLSYANLSNANLSNADLSYANLNHADLSHANLSKADLSKAILFDTTLNHANLNGATLSYANLSYADLSNATLSNADLSNANLSNADLSNANLHDANLSKIILFNTILSHANLSDVHLSDVHLSYATLSDADLSNADLSNADLSNANLHNANLRNANLNGANLCGADLSKANLSDTRLENTRLHFACLSGTTFSAAVLPVLGASLLWHPLPGESWTSDRMNDYLNHMTNERSLLKSIDSIDKKYTDVRLQLAQELLSSLDDVDVSPVAVPLMNVLSQDAFRQDEYICNRMNTVCENYLKQYNTHRIPNSGTEVLSQATELFTERPHLMRSLNGALHQLICPSIMKSESNDSAVATRLYDLYLKQPDIQPFTLMDDFGGYGTYAPDWNVRDAANFILRSLRDEGYAMLVSPDAFTWMLNPTREGSHPEWNHFFLYDAGQGAVAQRSIPPLETLFREHFPVFLESYLNTQKQSRLPLLFTVLLPPGDLQELFIKATDMQISGKKLVDGDSQLELKEIFSTRLTPSSVQRGGSVLEESHYADIIRVYGLDAATDEDKAITLLNLATVFTRFSSSAVFGTETESPQMLRLYAYALMEKAHTLDQKVFISPEGVDHFPDWEMRLLGLGNAFTCTAVLSRLMSEHVRHLNPEVQAWIMPSAWD
ncbi:hypothetical protein HAX39_24865 [Citrobacter freundii]|nr:hypothetical protein [Citrobacter freundii]